MQLKMEVLSKIKVSILFFAKNSYIWLHLTLQQR